MKKLDKLILKSFLGPFVVTFFIAVFVLMMQIVWKYIDDLVGKGLDLLTIGQFVWYASASLLALAMPIAILISSIMTFGNLGERFELVAIKSAGISLLRFMRPLAIVSVVLCVVTFLFANYVIPYSQLKFVTLYNDIFYKKPAFDLKEGTFFSHIPGYAIRVAKKNPDNINIHDILIYEQSNGIQNNTITAKDGAMNMSADKNFLEFHLKDGFRYQEEGNVNDTATEYVRLGFKEFKKLFDMSSLKKQTTPDSIFKDNNKMMSARQLQERYSKKLVENDSIEKLNLNRFAYYWHYLSLPDTILKQAKTGSAKPIPDSLSKILNLRVLNVVNDAKMVNTALVEEAKERERSVRSNRLEWHRKFAFSLSCLVLFFIAAPLGSIIRKGGLGMPLLVAIILFLVFHLLNMFGEKFVKEGILSPFVGMWLAVLVLMPVGFFFTYKAMHDSQLFNMDAYKLVWKKLRGRFAK